MGPFWEQPGRSILRDLYRDIIPPGEEWGDVERKMYEPGLEGRGSGRGEVLMCKRLRLGEVEGYARTFSSFHNWRVKHPEEKRRDEEGEGDIIDRMFGEMVQSEPEWKEQGERWRDFEVENEWGSVILLAKRK